MSKDAKENRIRAAYAEIKKFIDSSSYSKVVKSVNKVLSLDHNQPEAWHCKIVALIQLGQFQEAASLIGKAPNSKQMQFELAYCQYRLNDVSKAAATLQASDDKDSIRGKELKVQILYRLEEFGDCYSVYRELVRSTDDDLDMERSSNMLAAQVHNIKSGKTMTPAAPTTQSYEQWYNNACAAIAAGDPNAALKRLQKAITYCEKQLEGEDEEEIIQEQAIIRAQRGYVYQLLNKDKEAMAEYNAILQNKVDDIALMAILHNNMAVANRDANVFDSRKKMKSTQVAGLEHKLTSWQRDELLLNNCALACQAQQLQEDNSVVQDLESLIKKESTSETIRAKCVLVLAAVLAKTGNTEKALQTLHQRANKDGADSLNIRLAAAQLRLIKSDIEGGIKELSDLPPEARYKPGVVGSLVTLYNARKLKPQVSKLYKEAAIWYSKHPKSVTPSVIQLLRCASDFHLNNGDPRSAAEALENVRSLSNEEEGNACLPSLIHAYSQFDTAKAQHLSRNLPEPQLHGSALNADTLESSLGPKYFMKATQKTEDQENAAPTETAAQKEAAAASGGRVKPRKKKRRKTVLPKGYQPGDVADPERWLPRWQRKSGGPKRRKDKKREKDVGKGTQGGTGDASDKYDITKNPGQYKSSSVQQQQPEPAGPKRNMPKKKNKKK